MKYFDLHADTLTKCYQDQISSLQTTNYHIDLEKLKKGDSLVQCLAIFNQRREHGYDYQGMIEFIEYSKHLLEQHTEIEIVKNVENLKIMNQEIQHVLLTIEDLGPIETDINKINELYDLGFRMMTLTWNYSNALGHPNINFDKINTIKHPLTEAGIQAVERMNELGIIVDVSHLSDGGFKTICQHAKKPFIASHSNARSIKKSMRNLTDDMIKSIANSGGVIGINFYHQFLGESTVSQVSDIIKHIKHIHHVGGIECLAIGSDFDGIDSELEIKDASMMERLVSALHQNNYKERDIEKIFYKNALRVCLDIFN